MTIAALARTVAVPAAASQDGGGWLGQELFESGGVVVTAGGLLAAVGVIMAALVLSWVFRRGLLRFSQRRGARDRRAAVYTVGRIAHYVLLAIGVLLALEFIGLPASRFAVFAGAIGVGLGFGLQSIFNNFISGLILLFDRSLKVGDFVELESGVHGEVSDINIRATRITTNDNIEILVPNSEFVSGRVVNWTHNEVARRLRVPFGVAYGSDKEVVKTAALEAAAAVPFTLAQDGPRRPQVWLSGFGDSSLDFELVIWLTPAATKRHSGVKAAYNWELESALARHGLEIPFPQRDLHLRSAFGLSGNDAWSALGRPAPTVSRDAPAKRASGNDATEDVKREIAESPARPDPDA